MEKLQWDIRFLQYRGGGVFGYTLDKPTLV